MNWEPCGRSTDRTLHSSIQFYCWWEIIQEWWAGHVTCTRACVCTWLLSNNLHKADNMRNTVVLWVRGEEEVISDHKSDNEHICTLSLKPSTFFFYKNKTKLNFRCDATTRWAHNIELLQVGLDLHFKWRMKGGEKLRRQKNNRLECSASNTNITSYSV